VNSLGGHQWQQSRDDISYAIKSKVLDLPVEAAFPLCPYSKG
jgi:hypothetical protein